MLCLFQTVQAQNYFDVQRYSGTLFQSDARAMGVGNAFGALGGNPIATSINPAGLAAYPTSEFSFSLGVANSNISSSYLDDTYNDDKYSFNVPSVGYVFSERNEVSKEKFNRSWISSHFAINMNRRNGFNQSMTFSGINNSHSILDRFAEEVDYVYFNDIGIDSSTYGGMAYFALLVDPIIEIDPETNEEVVVGFVPSTSSSDRSVNQRQSLRTSGSINDLNLSVAGNYGDKILLGATLGIPVLNYRETGTYEEDNLRQTEDNFNAMRLRHRILDRGVGIFGQIGVILKPAHFIRIGTSLKTPTFYTVDRNFKTWMNGYTDDGNRVIEPSGYDFTYNMTTPWEVNASTAFLIGKKGFISADYTFFDGSAASLRAEGVGGALEYVAENTDIDEALAGVHQLRMGAELALGNFAIRGGYSATTSAYNEGYMPSSNMSSNSTISGGIGYRETLFYMDLGFQHMQRNSFFQPYGLSYTEVAGATNAEAYNSFILTMGFKF